MPLTDDKLNSKSNQSSAENEYENSSYCSQSDDNEFVSSGAEDEEELKTNETSHKTN